MRLEEARRTAEGVVEELRSCCSRIQVVGSIRRRKTFVNDIDIVAIPWNYEEILTKVKRLSSGSVHGGEKIVRFPYEGTVVELYLTTTESWGTLLLHRTGSIGHNIQLCILARKKGMKFASSNGLLDERGRKIAGETEESIFEALGLPYEEPEAR